MSDIVDTSIAGHKTFAHPSSYPELEIVDDLIAEEAYLVERLSNVERLLQTLLELRREEES